MKKYVCIIGADGNMGRRYAAICRDQAIAWVGVDKGDPVPQGDFISHYIIATPTVTHPKVLSSLMPRRGEPRKILIEKPVSVIDEIADLWPVEGMIRRGHSVYMVNQYAYYSQGITESEGPTFYDYYNTGQDGIIWDCIQLIHLARGEISHLKAKSPVWQCMINGTELNRELIDLCYVKMIVDFVSDGEEYGRLWGWKDIRDAHQKVLDYEATADRSAGPINLNTPAG